MKVPLGTVLEQQGWLVLPSDISDVNHHACQDTAIQSVGSAVTQPSLKAAGSRDSFCYSMTNKADLSVIALVSRGLSTLTVVSMYTQVGCRTNRLVNHLSSNCICNQCHEECATNKNVYDSHVIAFIDGLKFYVCTCDFGKVLAMVKFSEFGCFGVEQLPEGIIEGNYEWPRHFCFPSHQAWEVDMFPECVIHLTINVRLGKIHSRYC